MTANYTLLGPINQLLTMENISAKGAIKDEELSVICDAGILIKGSKIDSIRPYSELKDTASSLGAKIIKLKENFVCIPGLIDAHTHICFAGSRAKDYAMRNAGKSYLEIAEAGGGIWDTVIQTRKASQKELMHNTIKRANLLLQQGITTVEVKSGYGLSITEELKMLRAIKDANDQTKIDLIATCLAAHMLPKDFNGDHKEYLDHIYSSLFPILKEENLTQRIDAFVEKGAFQASHSIPYFKKAKDMGFDITVHADQFSIGGSQVAIEIDAISADHLEASKNTEIKNLAKSNVIAVALPGASIGLGCNFTPARKLLDAGGALAIASDWNPGSAPMGDLLTQACILGTFEKLTNAEVLAGITTRAAKALNLLDRGTLSPGMLADFNLFATDNYNEIFYQQGRLRPSEVWKKGKLIYQK